jgi:hypothetical protein
MSGPRQPRGRDSLPWDVRPWPLREEAPWDERRGPIRDGALFVEIERYLLKALLTPDQARQVDDRGWFEVAWPEQWLVLRVYTDRTPAVDAFQAPPRRAGGCRGARGGGPGPCLRSWDVGGAARRAARDLGLPLPPRSPLGDARAVVEAHRRGVLQPLLETADAAREAER